MIIAASKLWYSMHIDLIGPYSKSIRHQKPGGTIIKKGVSLACLKIVDPTTGWFEIIKFPCFDFNEVSRVNIEYIDKLSARVIQMFNKTWLYRYPYPHEVAFENGAKLKPYFTLLFNDFTITSI